MVPSRLARRFGITCAPFAWSTFYLRPLSNLSFLLVGISCMSTFRLGLFDLLTLAPSPHIRPIATRTGAIQLLPDAVEDRATLGTTQNPSRRSSGKQDKN